MKKRLSYHGLDLESGKIRGEVSTTLGTYTHNQHPIEQTMRRSSISKTIDIGVIVGPDHLSFSLLITLIPYGNQISSFVSIDLILETGKFRQRIQL